MMAEQIALTHHERWDGAGYPCGLEGEAIPLPGRIVAVADVFDALTHRRPYKDAWPIPVAVREIQAETGTRFDPVVSEAFARLDHSRLVHHPTPGPVAVENRTLAHRPDAGSDAAAA